MSDNKAELPLHLFHQGTNFKAFDFMGVHAEKRKEGKGFVFRVWAPRAESVSLVGDFNGWDKNSHAMTRLIDGQTFEIFVTEAKIYDRYKYCIRTSDGRELYKADPYAFHSETPGETSSNASKIYDLSGFVWTDKEYSDKRAHTNIYTAPMNIYEADLHSWKRHEDGTPLSYRELAKTLVPYVKSMGYTHVEFMPVTEYPFDGSWGYQVTGYYAVSSRLGTPHDFMHLIDCFHRAGIGVILDWVPAHFPKDDFGLYEFDGAPLYECSQWDRMENKGWGTRKFDYGRAEVISFLVSDAVFFFEKYHIDGLRVDAVASMLYLDYDKNPGEWIPNVYGENKNLEAVALFRRLNETVFSSFPYALMIAEESTAWPMITKPTYLGGLGFNFKWNMGWMNDVLRYFSADPIYRRHMHDKLTFSMMYAFSENFVLPISHDEVVHGKCSLIGKMPGTYEEKFAGVRAFFGYMFSHPGKKLNFMGSEFGQFKEWNYKEGVEFFLKDYPAHKKLSHYVKTLNELYLSTPALYEIDDSWDGFKWLVPSDADANFFAYERKSKSGDTIVVLLNLSGKAHNGYRLGVEKGKYTVLLNSDSTVFGGSGTVRKRVYATTNTYCHGKNASICFDIPALTCVYLVKSTD